MLSFGTISTKRWFFLTEDTIINDKESSRSPWISHAPLADAERPLMINRRGSRMITHGITNRSAGLVHVVLVLRATKLLYESEEGSGQVQTRLFYSCCTYITHLRSVHSVDGDTVNQQICELRIGRNCQNCYWWGLWGKIGPLPKQETPPARCFKYCF